MKRRIAKPSQSALPTLQQDVSSSKTKGGKGKRQKSPPLVWVVVYAAGVVVFLYVSWVGYSGKSTRDIPKPYTPVLRDNVSQDDWEWPHIHIVNTRFMQEQGNLTALGHSRLALFEIFCLTTMKHQSTQQFLWIIKTDPNLDPVILRQLVDDLRDYPNFYLVASNVNFRINEQFPGAWRDGAESQDLIRSKIYTGNVTLLETAMALQADFPVLETRLDADDGLHREFLEQVQIQALDKFETDSVKWLYWCAKRHLEWHWQERTCAGEQQQDTTLCLLNAQHGTLMGASHSELCITPGITVGFPVGIKEHDVPVHPHHLLYKRIKATPKEENCGYDDSADCLIFMETFIFEAIRSRTPTSAGMLNVEMDDKDVVKSLWVTYAYWNMLHESFGIQREHVAWMHAYLSDHLIDIVRDNLLGQCTTGHSCKDEAKKTLEDLIVSRANRTKRVIVKGGDPMVIAP